MALILFYVILSNLTQMYNLGPKVVGKLNELNVDKTNMFLFVIKHVLENYATVTLKKKNFVRSWCQIKMNDGRCWYQPNRKHEVGGRT